jgi:hypothetical protein
MRLAIGLPDFFSILTNSSSADHDTPLANALRITVSAASTCDS